MTVGDWIQIGILLVYTLTFMTGLLIGLLQLNHIIVDINERHRATTQDIEERQKRIDIAGDQWRQAINDTEKRIVEQDWKNKIIMIGLILINVVVWFTLRQDVTNKKS